MEHSIEELLNDPELLLRKEEKYKTCDLNVTSYFKTPIRHQEKTYELDNRLMDDLEMNGDKNIYKQLLDDENSSYKSQLVSDLCKTYSTDKKFLKQTQSVLTSIENLKDKEETNKHTQTIFDTWKELKEIQQFKDRFQYMTWDMFSFVNENQMLLSILSYYNLSSPLMTLVGPIFMLFVPFFVIQLMGRPLTFNTYLSILKQALKQNSLFKLFFNFRNSTLQEKAYLSLSVILYLIQIYQNINYCIQFYNNMQKIVKTFEDIQKFSKQTCKKINYMERICGNKSKYISFYNNMSAYKIKLELLDKKLYLTKPHSIVFQLNQLGSMMRNYYELYYDDNIHDVIMYAIGFNTYYDYMCDLNCMIKSKKLNKTKFVSKGGTKILGNYYLPHINSEHVCNDVYIKNSIITGANGSGKTTILKSCVINLILTQQFGFGCYDSASIQIYDQFHSYLNIPDTSGRDSLFQAEARQCKEILDKIKNNKNKRHFCIFDELYSGTNPEDAVDAGIIFLKYINSMKNVDFMITTHYFDLCEQMKETTKISLKHMETHMNDKSGIVDYTYKIKDGLCKMRAGKSVLASMNYPKEMFE